MKVIWNDKIVERSEVKIDMEDRGYQFADGIYDVVRAYNGKFFTLNEHVDRLFSSAEKIELVMPFTKDELKQLLSTLMKENGISTGNIYMQVTRGIGIPRNHTYTDPELVPPVFTATTTIVPRDQEKMDQGMSAFIVPDMRWLRCDIKSISLLGNIMAKHEAHKKGGDEAILHRDGIVTECSSSNVWMIKDDTIYTHPDGNLVLPGITKIMLLKVAREAGMLVKEEAFTIEDLKKADEVFASSTTMEAMPIVSIDGNPVGHGQRGAVVEKLQQLYVDAVEKECGQIR
ncbi:D-amino-acid transaminase [Carnobacterium viridans]|uniref:D-alanine aminotransferase n=1 Tax=Carnobacterium viridans TaxID=174587 RepID=A0A1H1BDH2_9LACT|nr:D-amino-acid transaminase [Carnobacterium viridans]UDE95827.1 D-amino-acid transaminase [Carnobacterium viridans]SDQ50048.1 D-alanine aminotransferase apoenzyme [Carnobacterium viridans]